MTTTHIPQRSPQTTEGAPMDSPVTEDVDPAVLLSLAALRARQRLTEAPGLIAHVRTLIVPASAQRGDGQPRGGFKEPPAPLRVDAVDEADSVYAQLLNWVSYWSEQLLIPGPVTAMYAWTNDREVQGFRAGVTPEGAEGLVQNLSTWLMLHQTAIERHPQAGEYFDDVSQIIRDLRAKFPRVSRGMRPVSPRPCPVCDEPAMGAEWHSDELTDFTLACSHCGLKGSTDALLRDRDVRTILTDMRVEYAPEPTEWWTKKQAVMEMRITPQTLNRYIQHDHLPTNTAEGTVYVNADRLRDIWRGKKIRDKEVRSGANRNT